VLFVGPFKPDNALSLEQASVVRDSAVHGEALVETKREGHRGRAGRRIVGGMQRGRKGRCNCLPAPWSR
jgi:hypothetical protein